MSKEINKYNPKGFKPHTRFERFGVSFYASEDEIDAHLPELEKLITTITNELSKSPNFDSISFSDVSAGYIQLNLINTTTPGYCYIILELSHDFDNIDDLIESAISEWKEHDTPERIKNFADFIADGNKYGWD